MGAWQRPNFLKDVLKAVIIHVKFGYIQGQRYTYRVLQTIQIELILLCVWAEPADLGSAKTALKLIQIWNLDRLTHILQFNVWGRVYAWKVKEITHDLNHDLTFYYTHNQLCVPQYKVNV